MYPSLPLPTGLLQVLLPCLPAPSTAAQGVSQEFSSLPAEPLGTGYTPSFSSSLPLTKYFLRIRIKAGSEPRCARSSAHPQEDAELAAHNLGNNCTQGRGNLARLGSGRAEKYFQSPSRSVLCNRISISGSCELDRPETGQGDLKE